MFTNAGYLMGYTLSAVSPAVQYVHAQSQPGRLLFQILRRISRPHRGELRRYVWRPKVRIGEQTGSTSCRRYPGLAR